MSVNIPEVPQPGKEWRRYPTYKDSGVEWLGMIPHHWKCRPLKYLTGFINGAPFKPSEWSAEGIPIIRIENLNASEDFNYTKLDVDPKYEVHEGDLLFGWSGNRGTSFGPFIWKRPGRHYLNQHIFRLSGYKVMKEWFYWALRAVTVFVEKQAHGIIGMVHITKGDLGAIPIPEVTLDEQQAVAEFLDRETAKIDVLIAKRQQLIALLEEKRTALVSRAVTKGLEPDLPMKDSGVEWLGKIPTHWELKRLKHLGEPIIGLTYDPSDVVGPDDQGVLVLRASNVSDRRIVLEDSVFVRCSIPERLRTKAGDILICSRSGSRALIGKCAKINGVATGLTFGTFMTVFRSAYNDYLFYAFNSTLFNYQSGAFLTSTINQLTVSNLKSFAVPVPPVYERSAISAYLDCETAKIDALIDKIREGGERLKEYRTALISAAVTGKIDVREPRPEADSLHVDSTASTVEP